MGAYKLCAALALVGCATTSRTAVTEAQRNASFARMQVHEAAIARCAASTCACAHAEALCQLATAEGSTDAALRCGRAQDGCAGDRAGSPPRDCAATAD